jgi:hypothetical protein
VDLGDRDKVGGAEILPDLDLMFDRPLDRRAEAARAHRLLFVGQPHSGPLRLRP